MDIWVRLVIALFMAYGIPGRVSTRPAELHVAERN